MKYTKKHSEKIAGKIPEIVKTELEKDNGKPHRNKSFTTIAAFCHVLPFLSNITM